MLKLEPLKNSQGQILQQKLGSYNCYITFSKFLNFFFEMVFDITVESGN